MTLYYHPELSRNLMRFLLLFSETGFLKLSEDRGPFSGRSNCRSLHPAKICARRMVSSGIADEVSSLFFELTEKGKRIFEEAKSKELTELACKKALVAKGLSDRLKISVEEVTLDAFFSLGYSPIINRWIDLFRIKGRLIVLASGEKLWIGERKSELVPTSLAITQMKVSNLISEIREGVFQLTDYGQKVAADIRKIEIWKFLDAN